MGRTNPTYRDRLRNLEAEWEPYRRALRRADQERFDRLFEHARRHADAAGYQNHADPLVAALLGMVIEHERRLDDSPASGSAPDSPPPRRP